MILYTIRDNVDPKYYPTCQFPARSMPQNGLLPFVQSFVCSIGNPCDPLSEYEEVPSYENATLVLWNNFFLFSPMQSQKIVALTLWKIYFRPSV